MNAAQFVGRVGGLAVALGVGAAVLTGTGVAWASEDSDGPAAAAESPATSASSGRDGSPPDTGSPRDAGSEANDIDAADTGTADDFDGHLAEEDIPDEEIDVGVDDATGHDAAGGAVPAVDDELVDDDGPVEERPLAEDVTDVGGDAPDV
ncbi:MAG: glycoside hydrolase family 1 protein, partial [Actinomycetota bacterium]|nr:glycoside hydrolase family 1 protein [Actinomycetota bacterium]